MKILAERIQQRRKQLKMSQMDFAEALDTAQAQVSRYETGQNDPTSEVLVRISKTLHVRVEWLLGLTDAMVMPATTESELSEFERHTIEALRLVDPVKQQELATIFQQIAGLMVR